jgi:hypothetical protein
MLAAPKAASAACSSCMADVTGRLDVGNIDRVEGFIEKRETRGRRFEICAVRITCAGGDTSRSKDAPAAHLCPPFGDGMGTLRSPFFLAPSYGCIRQFHRRSS